MIFTDDLAKKVINDNHEVQKKLILEFGKDCFIDGIYNAKYISEIVFSDENKLEQLNKIVIPVVIDELIKEVELLQNSSKGLIFVESALLYEFNLEDGFDYIISVSSKLENRKNRIKQDFHKRITSQISQEEKNSLADFIVENDKNLAELDRVANFIIAILETLPNREQ